MFVIMKAIVVGQATNNGNSRATNNGNELMANS
jgi:hypothetical protein